MFDVQTIVITLGLCVNLILFALIPTVIYYLVANAGFRDWVRRLIEDDDGKANKDDAKDAVILFFGYAFAWLLLNLILIEIVFTINNGLALIGIVGGIVAGIFGISKIHK